MTHNKGAPGSSYGAIPVGVFAAVVTMGACNPSPSPPIAPSSSAPEAAPERFGATLMQPNEQGAGQAVMVSRVSTVHPPVSDAELAPLDDAHLACVVDEVNDGAARFASAGEKRVTDHEVKRFAHDLADQRLAAQSTLRVRFSELGIEPAKGPVSEQARADIGGALDSLPGTNGPDFDRAYVEGQLRNLTAAAELLDRIIGHVKRPELAQTVEALHSKLDADVRRAQSIRDSLRNGTTNERLDAYDPDKLQR
jgi:predicted outer membrane protein